MLLLRKQINFLSNRHICDGKCLFFTQRPKVDFDMYGLVSNHVILKGCSPVIPQLHATQLLYNITDDNAGGQKLDFCITPWI